MGLLREFILLVACSVRVGSSGLQNGGLELRGPSCINSCQSSVGPWPAVQSWRILDSKVGAAGRVHGADVADGEVSYRLWQVSSVSELSAGVSK